MDAIESFATDPVRAAYSGLTSRVHEIFASADVVPGGGRPWDITVHTPLFYPRVLSRGSLGLGESYMDGWWDCPALDQLITRIFRSGITSRYRPWTDSLLRLRACVLNLQSRSRSFEVGSRHYDIGNELFAVMLDRRMIYSCAYWKEASSLDEAQEAKLDLIARKLRIEPGMSVLDIGCGWGGTARFLAERYGARVTGITVSREQAVRATEICASLPVEIALRDYREVRGRFDRIVSVGMFEHVGCKNYRTYLKTVRGLLAEDGLFLLHTIGRNVSAPDMDPWVERYIFPNAMLPSPRQISDAAEGLFVIEDWHNFGPDYDTTLMHWHENFERGWGRLSGSYDGRFRRMWTYYLLACAGTFRARKNQLWQIVLSPGGVLGGYVAPR
jgi:cyclopropane-fatty-acyl-phospholipid synthase